MFCRQNRTQNCAISIRPCQRQTLELLVRVPKKPSILHIFCTLSPGFLKLFVTIKNVRKIKQWKIATQLSAFSSISLQQQQQSSANSFSNWERGKWAQAKKCTNANCPWKILFLSVEFPGSCCCSSFYFLLSGRGVVLILSRSSASSQLLFKATHERNRFSRQSTAASEILYSSCFFQLTCHQCLQHYHGMSPKQQFPFRIQMIHLIGPLLGDEHG